MTTRRQVLAGLAASTLATAARAQPVVLRVSTAAPRPTSLAVRWRGSKPRSKPATPA